MFRRRVSDDREAVGQGSRDAGATRPGAVSAGSGAGDGGAGGAGSGADEGGAGGAGSGWADGQAGVPEGVAPAGVDVGMAHPARVQSYWLGGRDFFAADRTAGDAIGREFPQVPAAARAERAFLVRAVRFLAGPAGIRQFLDVGAGLPAGGNTHEIAQRIAAGARVVYADTDPVVIQHAKTLLAEAGLAGPGLIGVPAAGGMGTGPVSYLDADARDVGALLAGAATMLDLSQPVALIMLGVLGYMPDYGAARSVTSQLAGTLPAGSYVVIADGVSGNDPRPGVGAGAGWDQRYAAAARRLFGASAPGRYVRRRPDELLTFFDGLELVEPGVVACPCWRPDGRDDESGAAAYAGVARRQ